jgi:hypothetical protein
MKNPFSNLTARCVVAAAVATTLGSIALVSTSINSEAAPIGQDPELKGQIITQKVEVKAAVRDEVKKVDDQKFEVGGQVKPVVEKKAAVKVQAKVAAPAPPGADDDDDEDEDNPNALTKQYLQQFKSILEAEMRVLSCSCEITKEQRREIAFHGAQALKRAAVKLAENQGRIQQGQMMRNTLDPRKMAIDAMESAARDRLSPEQFARYKAELDARAKDQRQAEVLHLVATIDKLLTLSTEQREKLIENLTKQWDDLNYPTIETATIYEGYYPVVNTQSIYPVLNDDQKKIWGLATKISYSSVRNFTFNNGGMMQGGEPEDEDVKAAFAEGAKK